MSGRGLTKLLHLIRLKKVASIWLRSTEIDLHWDLHSGIHHATHPCMHPCMGAFPKSAAFRKAPAPEKHKSSKGCMHGSPWRAIYVLFNHTKRQATVPSRAQLNGSPGRARDTSTCTHLSIYLVPTSIWHFLFHTCVHEKELNHKTPTEEELCFCFSWCIWVRNLLNSVHRSISGRNFSRKKKRSRLRFWQLSFLEFWENRLKIHGFKTSFI